MKHDQKKHARPMIPDEEDDGEDEEYTRALLLHVTRYILTWPAQ